MRRALFVTAIFSLGLLSGLVVNSSFSAEGNDYIRPVDSSEINFMVSVDEVSQKFVFGERFAGQYSRTFTMSDGTERRVTLTPMEKDGRLVVELRDGNQHSYMGPNGYTYNGNLLINLTNVDELESSHN